MKSFAGIFRTAQTLKFGRVILLSRRNFLSIVVQSAFFLLRQFDGRLDLYEKL